MTFSPFLCLNEEIMQCFFVNSAKIVFKAFRYNKSLKPKKVQILLERYAYSEISGTFILNSHARTLGTTINETVQAIGY